MSSKIISLRNPSRVTQKQSNIQEEEPFPITKLPFTMLTGPSLIPNSKTTALPLKMLKKVLN